MNMAAYSTTFQCPATGQDVTARYAFGKVSFKPLYGSVHYSVDAYDSVTEAEREELKVKIARMTRETEEWCHALTGRRFRSYDEANEFVVEVTEGQSWGLEED
jgi:hypothetical protein